MHVRLVTVRDAKDVDTGISFIRDNVVPVVPQYAGHQGLTVSADRDVSDIVVGTWWATAEDLAANSAAMPITPEQIREVFSPHITVQRLEQLLSMGAGVFAPPGAFVAIDRRGAASTIHDAVADLRAQAPILGSRPDFLGLSMVVDRADGALVLLTTWADRSSAELVGTQEVHELVISMRRPL